MLEQFLSLVGLQVFTRVITFTLNQIVLRNLDPGIYGVVAIQFDLVFDTIVFICREPLRCSLLRINFKQRDNTKGGNDIVRSLIGLSYIAPLIGLLLCSLTIMSYTYLFKGADAQMDHYYTGLACFCIASFLTLLSEPFYLLSQASGFVRWRSICEGSAIFIKSVSIYALISFTDLPLLLIFGLCQMIYGSLLCLSYILCFLLLHDDDSIPVHSLYEMLPKYKDFTSDTSREYLSLVSGFVQQSIAKYFLTEGNKLMLSAFASVKDQGSYAIVDNYGSLVVRMVFLPLEDALRSQFSSMTGDDSSRLERKSLLMKWLKRSLYFGILFLIFGPSYSSLFVKWFLGMKWQGAGAATVLSAYSAMIPFLGMNGILEAFVYSFASQKDVVGMIPFMVLNFMVYIGSSLFFVNVLHYGPIGLIYGNILNMSMRIAYCLIFIRRSYEEYMLPSFSTLCVASVVLSRILVQLIMIFIEHDILRVVSGGLVCLLLCLVFVLEERGLKAKQE